MADRLQMRFSELPLRLIYGACCHSRSQLYKWRASATLDRKVRSPKALDQELIENTAMVVAMFPHFGGVKGQAFLLYHGLGLIGQKAYDDIKKKVKRILCQEVSQRRDLPVVCESYEHIRPDKIGQIWAEDFTELVVNLVRFKLALLIDVFSQYILGWAVARRATEGLVAIPVRQALAQNSGKPPEKFLLRDNGVQYESERHGQLLEAHEIVNRHIPPCTPQYNGSVECGGKELKNVFYNVWERLERKPTDKEKTLDERVWHGVEETVHLLNFQIPRPALGGVTPADVQSGFRIQRQRQIAEYREEQAARKPPPPLSRPFWDVIKDGVQAELMSTKELLTKLAFFGMRPLRRVAKLNQVVWGY
ncbi:MAG TPA: transposase [Deltaproteobacteria bacterium]|nr:transposase [Deltaproteobacteria bacterium]